MKAIILAAGYSTRLYPLTKNFPKPLLDIANVPIIERIIEKVVFLKNISNIYIVTNSKYFHKFNEWLLQYKKTSHNDAKIEIIDDGTDSNETRLGPVGDITLVLKKYAIEDDVLILAGDNLFELDLNKLCSVRKINDSSVLAVYQFDNIGYVKNKFGVVLLDENNKLINFEEKPEKPKSSIAATAIYIIRKNDIKHIINLYERPHDKEINAGEIIHELLINNIRIFCVKLNSWYDIGSHEDLKQANEYYSKNQ